MAGDIKGITIEFRGDTTPLQKALRKVRNESKDVDKELGYINKALKFSPKSTELLAQKQAVLKKAVEDSGKRLQELQQAQANLDAAGVDRASAEYRELEREILKAENQDRKLNAELKKINAALSPLGQASAKMKAFGQAAEKAGQTLKPLSAAGAAVDAALTGLTYKAGRAADDLNTLSKVSGIGTDELQKYALASDLVDVSVETIAKSQSRMKKSMQSAANGTGATAKAFAALGVSVADSSGRLRNQDEVFADVLQSLGKMKNETERDALAMQIFGRRASELNPLIEDGGETYKRVADIFASNSLEIVDQKTLDKANQFNDQLDLIKAEGTLALQTIGMQLAGYLAPAMERIAEVAGKIFGWLSQLSPQVLTIVGIVAGAVAVLAPLLIAIGKISMGLSAIMSLLSLAGPAIAALAGPIGIAIAAITAIITIGVLLYKNWDTIKAKAEGLKSDLIAKWEAIKAGVTQRIEDMKTAVQTKWAAIKASAAATFETIKNKIVTPIEAARAKVKSIVDRIKGIFPLSVGKIFSNLRIPSIKVHGGKAPFGIGGLGTKPSISVSWHAQGGIFDRPTLLTDSRGNVHGLGENGAEAIIPLKELWDQLDQRIDGVIDYDRMAQAMVRAMTAVTIAPVLEVDGREVARTTAPFMRSELDRIDTRSSRKLGYV